LRPTTEGKARIGEIETEDDEEEKLKVEAEEELETERENAEVLRISAEGVGRECRFMRQRRTVPSSEQEAILVWSALQATLELSPR
jgi:hypothetical protein